MESLKPDSILLFYEVFAILIVLRSLYFTAVKKGIEQLKSLTVLLIVVNSYPTVFYGTIPDLPFAANN